MITFLYAVVIVALAVTGIVGLLVFFLWLFARSIT